MGTQGQTLQEILNNGSARQGDTLICVKQSPGTKVFTLSQRYLVCQDGTHSDLYVTNERGRNSQYSHSLFIVDKNQVAAFQDLETILGDKLVCVSTDTASFTVGETYEVTTGWMGLALKTNKPETNFSTTSSTFRVATQPVQQAVGAIFDNLATHAPKGTSDGSADTTYYDFPAHASELRHLISAQRMSFARGNVFKACYRLGEKEGVDPLYDLNKIKMFAEEMIEMHQRGEHV